MKIWKLQLKQITKTGSSILIYVDMLRQLAHRLHFAAITLIITILPSLIDSLSNTGTERMVTAVNQQCRARARGYMFFRRRAHLQRIFIFEQEELKRFLPLTAQYLALHMAVPDCGGGHLASRDNCRKYPRGIFCIYARRHFNQPDLPAVSFRVFCNRHAACRIRRLDCRLHNGHKADKSGYDLRDFVHTEVYKRVAQHRDCRKHEDNTV